jgi:hypothetical protein
MKMMKVNLPSKYNFEARYVPSLVCSVPFFFLGFYFLWGIDNSFWNSVVGLAIAGLGLTTAVFIVMVNFCRDLGKLIEEKMFSDGLSFPTTTFLLDSDTNLSVQYKAKVIKKIKKDFDIDLKNHTNGEQSGRRSVNEAVRRINSMFFGKNDLLLQRTIQFGFSKNLFAGSIIAIIVSTAGIVVSSIVDNFTALNVATVLLAFYVVVGLFSYLSIRFTARHYAQALYGEFMAN